MKIKVWFVLSVLIVYISISTFASDVELIRLNNPGLVSETLNQPYDLESIDLRLPQSEQGVLNEESHDKLLDMLEIYGARDEMKFENNLSLSNPDISNRTDRYRLNVEDNEGGNILSLNPLPGVSVNAGYDKDEEENSVRENTNISLQYWMNNRTSIRAEYGMENRAWWDIAEIKLEDENEVIDQPKEEVTFNEERNETGRLGISYQANDHFTISADYIDSTSIDKDYSTIFGVEYRDELGSVRYHYQVDFGDQKMQETGLEFGYKELATFNASYKLYDPEAIEEELNKAIWDFGLDLNLNEISTISLGYQLKQEDALFDKDEEDESNIQAQLKIQF
ncbi:MAG: hypothetical protein ACLFUI_06895 [Halanaerobiales bacterium]